MFYHWRAGPLPPPHYWEYSVRLGPAPHGVIEVIPGYPSAGVPRWAEQFGLYGTHLDWLFQVIDEQGLFEAGIAAASEVPVGSNSQTLAVTADGREYQVPAFAVPERAAAAVLLCDSARALVPPLLWDTLRARREAYAARARNR